MNSPVALAELAASTSVPICASETLGSRFPYKDMLEAGAIGIVMTDLVWTGGLTEGRKIAALADTYLGTELLPSVFERSDLTSRLSSL